MPAAKPPPKESWQLCKKTWESRQSLQSNQTAHLFLKAKVMLSRKITLLDISDCLSFDESTAWLVIQKICSEPPIYFKLMSGHWRSHKSTATCCENPLKTLFSFPPQFSHFITCTHFTASSSTHPECKSRSFLNSPEPQMSKVNKTLTGVYTLYCTPISHSRVDVIFSGQYT